MEENSRYVGVLAFLIELNFIFEYTHHTCLDISNFLDSESFESTCSALFFIAVTVKLHFTVK